jgi:hypothetical protein
MDEWQWHKWFAWFPVEDRSGKYHWLKYVERRKEWLFMTCNPEDAIIYWVYRKL